jgi:hypothetical protein
MNASATDGGAMKATWLLLFSFAAASLVASATPLTFDITSASCGSGICATVTLTQLDANDVSVDVEASPNLIINTGAHEAFAFNSPLTGLVISLSAASAPYFAVDPNIPTGFDYGICRTDTTCPSVTNSSGCCTSLTFTVHDSSGLTILNLVQANSSGQIFEADFWAAPRGPTFEAFATCPANMDCSGGGGVQAVPEPLSMALTGGGLLFLGVFRRKIFSPR